MNDFMQRRSIQTTLGDLIAALSEEIRPFLKSDRETYIVVGYIFNDLLRRARLRRHRRAAQRRLLLSLLPPKKATQKG